jgi:hypothetical protein
MTELSEGLWHLFTCATKSVGVFKIDALHRAPSFPDSELTLALNDLDPLEVEVVGSCFRLVTCDCRQLERCLLCKSRAALEAMSVVKGRDGECKIDAHRWGTFVIRF